MRQSQKNDGLFLQIQKKFIPSLLGILWLTQKSIWERESPFDELNYFFDGILETTVLQLKQPLDPNLAMSMHYGNPVHLGQVKASSPQLEQTLNKFLKIMQKNSKERRSVLVIVKGRIIFPLLVKKANPRLQLDFLNL